MALLLSDEIFTALQTELSQTEDSIQILTAFCKIESIKKINSFINTNISKKRIMFRFLLYDLISGSTDFEILEFCIKNNWKVFIRFDLHAKAFIFDNRKAIIGSANVTNKGLTGNKNSNIEISTPYELENSDILKVEKLFSEALVVTDELIFRMKIQLEQTQKNKTENCFWNNDIINLCNPKVEALFTSELPSKNIYEIGEEISFLNLIMPLNLQIVQNQFRLSNVYKWLYQILIEKNREIYFGELSMELHNILIEDPKPYRKDVKILLTNLLSIIQDWKIDEFIIDRPNYSQRIGLNKSWSHSHENSNQEVLEK